MRIPAISTPFLSFFRRIVRGYFRRHFHAVRISHPERLCGFSGPVIVYANHSSWWDPMVSVLLAWKLMPTQRHYAPMETVALEKYRVLKHIGIFPVDGASARGAAQFLRTGEAVLSSGGVLWITPQGRFADPRERPLLFKAGMASLAARVVAIGGRCTLIPLAIEYPFWDERLPEVLLHVAEPVVVVAGESTDSIQQRAIFALEEGMNALKDKALSRSGEEFQVLLQGRLGTGGFYALGRRIRAVVTREPYVPEHTPARELLK